MAIPARHRRYSYREYLAFEASSNVKHEFAAGEIYAMAGGTPEHAGLTAAVTGALLSQLRGGLYRVYSPDLRVRILASDVTTYPDVSVVCGDLERDADDVNAALNPRVIVEVLSDSTCDYDLGEKFEHYKRIPSLEAIVFVSHKVQTITVWIRPAGRNPADPLRAECRRDLH